jgi:hypothetical protein
MARIASFGVGPAVHHTNHAAAHAVDMIKSEAARVNATLAADFEAFLSGQCVYLRDFLGRHTDDLLFRALKADIEEHFAKNEGGLKEWSKHHLIENPDASPVFTALCEFLCRYFDVEAYATRLNYYKDGSEWKPFHHDSHAYGGRALREDFTMGISLGATRDLAWLHEPSKQIFTFPQRNGDCFAFTSKINTAFMHGVPRGRPDSGDRFSIIVWGRRRTINPRNGGALSLPSSGLGLAGAAAPESVEDAVQLARRLVSVAPPAAASSEMPRQSSTASGGSAAGIAKGPAPKKKNRLQ